MSLFSILSVIVPTKVPTAAANDGSAGGGASPAPGALITTPSPTFINEFNGPASGWEAANWSNGDPFNTTWQPDNVAFNNGIMSLVLDDNGCPGACRNKPFASGEYRTTKSSFGYGYYEVRLKAAKGDGLVTSFFTYTGTYGKQDHHEIDFEVLGKNTNQVQLNFYVEGQGNHEKVIDLGFDAAEGFHNYGFHWTKDQLTWYVDGKPVHSVKGKVPYKPGKIMVNLWPGTGVDGWLEPFNYPGQPIYAQYDWVKFLSNEAGEIVPIASIPIISAAETAGSLTENPASAVDTLFTINSKKISANEATMLDAEKWAQIYQEQLDNFGMPAIGRDALRMTAAEMKIVNWLLARELGANSPVPLSSRGLTPYWRTLLIMVFLNDREHGRDILTRLGISEDLLAHTPGQEIAKEDQLAILNELDSSDPRLQAEILGQRTILLWNLGKKQQAQTLLAQVYAKIEYLLDNNNEKAVKAAITKRWQAKTDELEGEYQYYRGKTMVLKAKLMLLEAGEHNQRSEKEFLEEVYNTAIEASDKFIGLEKLETRLLALECRARQGFIAKNSGENPARYFDEAGKLRNYLIDWREAYTNHSDFGGTPPLWLKEMLEQADLWLAKVAMAGAGQEARAKQLAILQTAEESLRLLSNSTILSTSSLYDAKRTLAENLALQAFNLMNEGQPYAEKLENAKDLFKAVAGRGLPLTRAEAALWLGKISIVEAGRAADSAGQRLLLNEAKSRLDSALAFVDDSGSPLMQNGLLSSLYAAYGDIYSAQKNFAAAGVQYRLALSSDDLNYFAVCGLGDVLNWGKDYKEAINQYNKVPENNPASQRARLGIMEAEARMQEDYSKLDEQFLIKIFDHEPPASSLVARAIDLLVEKYGSNETEQAKILLVADHVLGTTYRPSINPDKSLEAMLKKVLPDLLLASFKAKLALDVAQALVWADENPKAIELLNNHQYCELVRADAALCQRHDLILATAKLRNGPNNETARAALEIGQRLIDNPQEEFDLNLLAEAIKLKIEAYAATEDYAMMARTATALIEDKRIEQRFIDQGQQIKYLSLKSELFLGLVDALMWNKKYGEALQKLAEYEINELQDIIINGAQGKTKNTLLLTRAAIHLRLGEVYRFAPGQRDLDKSRKNYNLALADLNAVPADSFKKGRSALFAQVYFGLSKLEELAGNRTAAQAALEQAILFSDALPASERQRINAAKTNQADELVTLSHRSITQVESQQTDYQENANINLPLIRYRWNGNNKQLSIFAPLNYRWDRTAFGDRHSLYAGLRMNLDLPGVSLGTDILAKAYAADNIPTGTQEGLGHPPTAIGDFFLWSQYATLNASLSFDGNNIKHKLYGGGSSLNSVYANPMFNFGFTQINGLSGLRVGAEYNAFNYVYQGSERTRQTVALATRYDYSFLDDTLAIHGLANWPSMEFIPGEEYSQNNQSIDHDKVNGWKSTWSFDRGRFGAGLDVNLGRWNIPVIISPEIYYSRQFSYMLNNREYSASSVEGRVNFSVNIFDLFMAKQPN